MLLLSGSDVFYDVYIAKSSDGGKTFSEQLMKINDGMKTEYERSQTVGFFIIRNIILFHNQNQRKPVISYSGSGMICDVNTEITADMFVQKSCMGLYLRYMQLKEKGGHYFGAFDENGLLGAMARVMPAVNGFRCDFFWCGNFKTAVPQLIEKCQDAVGEVYLQIADCDNECAVWENIFNIFLSQNFVLTRNLRGKFPALQCNEVFENYFEK